MKVRRMRGIAQILLLQNHTRLPLPTLRTLCTNAAAKLSAVCAHRKCRVVQVVVARWPSVFVPCLQIRVGRFDSGPSLQLKRTTVHSVVLFFMVDQLALATHTVAPCAP